MENKARFPIPHSPPPLSFKQKLKHSLCFSCCFRRHRHLNPQPPLPTDDRPALIWLKAKPSGLDHSGEFKEKCRAILGRISNPGNNKHRKHSSTEFRYDPLSYSLNFEDGYDEAPQRNFSARLPPSPPRTVHKDVGVREIAAIG